MLDYFDKLNHHLGCKHTVILDIQESTHHYFGGKNNNLKVPRMSNKFINIQINIRTKKETTWRMLELIRSFYWI